MRFAFKTNAVPQFEIEQPPDAVVIVAMLRAVLVEELLDRLAPEISTVEAPRFKQHLADRFQPRPSQPAAPRRRKSELRAVKNFARQQVFDRFLKDPFTGQPLNLHLTRNPRREFNQHVIQKRYAALN